MLPEAQSDYYRELQRQAWEVEPVRRCEDCYYFSEFPDVGEFVCRYWWRSVKWDQTSCQYFLERDV